jgi:hypothetical protein
LATAFVIIQQESSLLGIGCKSSSSWLKASYVRVKWTRGHKNGFSLPNRLFFMLASVKKSLFFTLKLLFFMLELLFFTLQRPA